MKVFDLINACGNVRMKSLILVEDRVGHIFHNGKVFDTPEEVLNRTVNTFILDATGIKILVDFKEDK